MRIANTLSCALLLLLPFFTTLSAQNCGDEFTDSGGNGQYGNNENLEWTICSDLPDHYLNLEFNIIQLEECCDFLSVFNGIGTTDPIVQNLINPDHFTSTSPDGCLTVTFTSDFSIVDFGWSAIVECFPIPTCFAPSTQGLTSTPVDDGILLSWMENPIVNSWEIEWGLQGFSQGDGMTEIVNGTPNLLLEDINEGLPYQFYIRSICPDNTLSFWNGPINFSIPSECNSDFFDSGGPDNNYQANEELVWTFCPPNEEEIIELNFSKVQINFSDQLNIYTGTTLDEPIFFGLNFPFNLISTSPDGCLTVEFISDQFTQSAGWEATVSCIPLPDCPRPEFVNIFGITTNTALIFSGFGGGVTWDIEYGPPGFAHGEGTIATESEDVFTLEGLMPGTQYQVYTRIHCPGGGLSAWSPPFLFITQFTCGIPFFDPGGPDENYENNQNISAVFCPDNPDQVIQLIFTQVDIPECCDQLQILDGQFGQFLLEPDLTEPRTFTSNSEDGCLLVAFFSDDQGTGAGWEAEVLCLDRPNCQAPINLEVVNSSFTTATIEWTDINPSDGWDIEYGPQNFEPGFGTLIENFNTNPFEITGLSPSTNYDLYIRTNCESEGESFWSDPFTFSTYYNCDASQFYDSGGPDGNHQIREDRTWVMCPDLPDKTIQLDFTEVEFFTPSTNLRVFEGIGLDVPLSPQVLSPSSFISYALDGCLTVRFITNDFFFVSSPGWVANVECIDPPPCPDPSQLKATPLSNIAMSIDLKNNANASNWEVEHVLAGFNQGNGIFTTFEGNPPFVISGLTSFTSYDFYIRSKCDEEQNSNWKKVSGSTLQGCENTFFDSGGEFGNYLDNQFNIWSFCAEEASDFITLNFSSINLEFCCDEISIYDGIGIGDPLIIDLEEPTQITSTTAGGCLTVVFSSDVSFTEAGWVMDINCLETDLFEIADIQNFQLFPQPSDHELFIGFSADDAYPNTNFELLDLTGQSVLNQVYNIETGDNQFRFDVGQFPAGIYFLQIKNEAGSISKKVIIQ